MNIVWLTLVLFIGVTYATTDEFDCDDTSNNSTDSAWYNLDEFYQYTSIILHCVDENNTLISTRYDVHDTDQLTMNPCYNKSKPLVMFVHGFHNNQSSILVQEVVEAFCFYNKQYNVATLDWDFFALLNYYTHAAPMARCYGKYVANVMYNTSHSTNGTVSPSDVYCVGASLGCHVCGGIGYGIYDKTGVKMGRLTALDPAGPMFGGEDNINTLKREDATCVDVIHSDAGGYGMSTAIGHYDYWPNGGNRTQPGCPQCDVAGLDSSGGEECVCSHERCVVYYMESVRNSNASMDFYAIEHNAIGTMPPDPADIVPMGINCPCGAVGGNFYLRTNAQSLFSRGMDGIDY